MGREPEELVSSREQELCSFFEREATMARQAGDGHVRLTEDEIAGLISSNDSGRFRRLLAPDVGGLPDVPIVALLWTMEQTASSWSPESSHSQMEHKGSADSIPAGVGKVRWEEDSSWFNAPDRPAFELRTFDMVARGAISHSEAACPRTGLPSVQARDLRQHGASVARELHPRVALPDAAAQQ